MATKATAEEYKAYATKRVKEGTATKEQAKAWLKKKTDALKKAEAKPKVEGSLEDRAAAMVQSGKWSQEQADAWVAKNKKKGTETALKNQDFGTLFADQYMQAQEGYDKQEALYKQRQAAEEQDLQSQLAEAMRTAQGTRDSSMQAAAANQTINQRNLPAQLARMGIRGGASETAQMDLNRTYQNATNAARGEYAQSEAELSNAYASNKAAIGSRYSDALANLATDRRNNALAQAQMLWQAQQGKDALGMQRDQIQFDQGMAQKQYDEGVRQFGLTFGENQRQFNAQIGGAAPQSSSGYSGGGYSGGGVTTQNKASSVTLTGTSRGVDPMGRAYRIENYSDGTKKTIYGK